MHLWGKHDFKPSEIKHLNKLIEDFQVAQLPGADVDKKKLFMEDLEAHEFMLLEKQVDHDLVAIAAFRADSDGQPAELH